MGKISQEQVERVFPGCKMCKTPSIAPPSGGIAMRHQYTRAELESITQETAIYIEGAGIAQLQWGGLEIAEGVKDGYLYCKHIKPFAMDLYDKYWMAFDGPPERKENA
ncbi:hypothetical protein ADH75_02865 [Flavonifractor plautii]|nr:hypothetical protein A4U99_14560 [Flavonifractor plautii]OXE48532.1 hypothetical protein ADH75_02865 [Flavonifractor plautii]